MKIRLAVAISFFVFFFSCKKENTNSSPATGAPIRPVTSSSNAYVTTFFEYRPGPGQFINTSLASDSDARTILGNAQSLLTLGAWGGYVVYGFDHTVIDAAGTDLIVVGNASPLFAEPGVVWVMQDVNGNGKPDDPWYEVAGSETGKPGYIRNYAVTYYRPTSATGNVPWKDNRGDSGYVLTDIFNTGDHYPDNITADFYTLTGTLLPTTNINNSDTAYITSTPFAYGYCDNTTGGDSLDIASAIDSVGNPVKLKGIDFIKIQTGILFNMGNLGEQSTEVKSIADKSLIH